MRFQAAAAVLTASLAHSVAADAQSVLSDAQASASSIASEVSASGASIVESATSSKAPLPEFTPTDLKGDFLEQFTDDWATRWQASHAKKEQGKDSKSDEEWAYVGEWAVEEPKVYPGMSGDKGLVIKNAAAHHAISAKFPKKIENKGKTLVVQYEVKLQNGLECGGAYMKLLRDNKALHLDEFSNASPYVIMFGPDKCGSTNKVHLIINHKNPKSGEYEEKHLKLPPTASIVKTTELYTLIINPNNTYSIRQNDKQVKEGNMFEDFEPAFNPAKEIDDETDTKPEDWVDTARIPDPDATKPEDWDEDAPAEIIDEEATMPRDWLEDEPLTVPDPEAVKPEDWDEEEDGDWLPPTIPNPKGDEVSGLGPWTKPKIKNPAYKGKWSAPFIDNPAYKGVWASKKIPNPNYYEVKNPAELEPMGAIGFEIWTMQNDILFDNIYIGHSVEDAAKFAEETFHAKIKHEQAALSADAPKKDETKPPKSPNDLVFMDDPVHYMREKLDLFLTIAKRDPIQAIKFVPEVVGGLAAVFLTAILLLVGLIGLGSSAPSATEVKKAAEKAKVNAKDATEKIKAKATDVSEKVAAQAVDAKDKVVVAASSAVESSKAEINKRSTRNTS